MKKTKMKNKKGFTLSELLMVIAIIVILSGATMIGVVSTINKTRENAAKAAMIATSHDFLMPTFYHLPPPQATRNRRRYDFAQPESENKW